MYKFSSQRICIKLVKISNIINLNIQSVCDFDWTNFLVLVVSFFFHIILIVYPPAFLRCLLCTEMWLNIVLGECVLSGFCIFLGLSPFNLCTNVDYRLSFAYSLIPWPLGWEAKISECPDPVIQCSAEPHITVPSTS